MHPMSDVTRKASIGSQIRMIFNVGFISNVQIRMFMNMTTSLGQKGAQWFVRLVRLLNLMVNR